MLLKRIALVVLLACLVSSGIAFVWANCHNDQDHEGNDCEEPFKHLITGLKWQWLENHTVEYIINEDKLIPGLPKITIDTNEAAKTWSGIKVDAQTVAFYLKKSNTRVFGILPEAGDDMNIVGWYPLDDVNRNATANTAVRVKPGTKRIIEVDLQLNYYAPLSTHAKDTDKTYCMRNTLTHEFGHWLGLGDVKPQHQCDQYKHYTMWQPPSLTTCDKEDLSCEDIWGAKHIYGLTGG